jgi:hypothetical protein
MGNGVLGKEGGYRLPIAQYCQVLVAGLHPRLKYKLYY